MRQEEDEDEGRPQQLQSSPASDLREWLSQGQRFSCRFNRDPLVTQDRVESVACHLIDDLVGPQPSRHRPPTQSEPGTEPEQQCITFLHGYPTCSYDFYPLVQCLLKAQRLRVRLLLIDLLGYGDSDKGVATQRVSAQQHASVVQAVWRRYGITQSHLVMHDLGVSVGQELLCRQHRGALSVQLGKLFWLNGPVFVDHEQPHPLLTRLAGRAGWLTARLMSRSSFADALASMFSKEHPASQQWLADAYEVLCNRGGDKVHHRLARSILKDRQRYKHLWQGATELAVRQDPQRSMFCWGLQDPVSGQQELAYLQKRFQQYGVRVSEQADLGHWPHVEEPSRVAQLLTSFLQEDYTPSYTQRTLSQEGLDTFFRHSSCSRCSGYRVSVDNGRLNYIGQAPLRHKSSASLTGLNMMLAAASAGPQDPSSGGAEVTNGTSPRLNGYTGTAPHSTGAPAARQEGANDAAPVAAAQAAATTVAVAAVAAAAAAREVKAAPSAQA